MKTLTFNKIETFNLAKYILEKDETVFTSNDQLMQIQLAGDMEIVGGLGALSVCQIWDSPSFHGPADFIIS